VRPDEAGTTGDEDLLHQSSLSLRFKRWTNVMGIGWCMVEHCKHSNKKMSAAEHETCNAEIRSPLHSGNGLHAGNNRST
jgi:hypothetical protein